MIECEDFLAGAMSGDLEATEQLLRWCAPPLREIVAAQIPAAMRPLVDAEDILQETFAEAFHEISRCRAETGPAFFAWLRTIAEHNLTDLKRRLFAQCRDVRRNQRPLDAEDALERLAWAVCPLADSPSRGARRSELGAQLRAALAEMPDAYRAVVTLYDLGQLPVDSVARRLDCSVGSVYMRRQRAHRLLRDILQSYSRFA